MATTGKCVIPLPPQAERIIRTLETRGFAAYAVGGCVRDSLIGAAVHDWDLCTSALPEETAAVFSGESDIRLAETGLRHGTITLLVQHTPFEVTTFRSDGPYSDCRRPDSVRFVRTIEDDLSRRDFTINAMAYHPERGLLDLFGGQEDLRGKVLRCVGDPNRRFTEDALRMLRALRFAAVYAYELAPETEAAMYRNKLLLNRISAERVASELCKMLTGADISRILMKYAGICAVFLPEMLPAVGFAQHTPYHTTDVWTHTASAVGHANAGACINAAAPARDALIVRLSLLFHDLGKPQCHTKDSGGCSHFYGHAVISAQIADQALTRLKFDQNTRRSAVELIAHHDDRLSPDPRLLKRRLNQLGPEQLLRLMAVQQADISAQAPEYRAARLRILQETEEAVRQILARKECFQTKDLSITGRDLIAEGIPRGPIMGQILARLTELVMEERIRNEREQLLAAARRLYAEAERGTPRLI